MAAIPRTGLARRRKCLGLTQEALADRLAVDRVSVSRWERGITEPQPYLRAELATVLRVVPAELDVLLTVSEQSPSAEAFRLPAPGSSDEGDQMIRRDFLRMAAITAAAIATPMSAPEHDPNELTGQQAIADHLWRAYGRSGNKSGLYPTVAEHLDTLQKSLRLPQSSHAFQRRCGTAASAFQLAGEILFDANAYTDAVSCYVLAADAAKEAGDHDLWACALIRHALVLLAEGAPHAAADLLAVAAGVARRGDPGLPTTQWMAAVQAEAFAGMGQAVECHRALEKAESVAGLAGVTSTGWLRFEGSRLPEQRGGCLMELGDNVRAVEVLSEAAALAVTPRRSAAVHSDLARLALGTGDLDRLDHHVSTLADLGSRNGSGYIRKRLSGLRRRIVSAPDPRLRRIADRLDLAGFPDAGWVGAAAV